jgi:hypothetical protein
MHNVLAQSPLLCGDNRPVSKLETAPSTPPTLTPAPMNATANLSHVIGPAMFNVLQLGVNRIWALSYILNSVSVPGFEKLKQKADAIKAPTTYASNRRLQMQICFAV